MLLVYSSLSFSARTQRGNRGPPAPEKSQVAIGIHRKKASDYYQEMLQYWFSHSHPQEAFGSDL